MIHISQFYSCSEVKLACELYYICELGKYSKYNHGKAVSLDGVILNSCLKKSKLWDYFRMAVSEGWLIETGVSQDDLMITAQTPLNYDKMDIVNYLYTLDAVEFDSEDAIKRRNSYEYDTRIPVKSQISFELMTNRAWKWSINGADGQNFNVNNRSLNHNRADQSWLSLIAFVAVERLFTGHPDLLGLVFSNNTVLNTLAISYIMILADETQALTGWCHYALDETISENTKLQLGYTAWYAKGKDLGLLDRWYSGKEKFAYLEKLNIGVGDLVMYYEREKAQKANYVKSVASCHLAKIKALSDDTISLELINTVKPYFMGKEDFDNHTIAVKKMYANNPPYATISITKKDLSLADVGVQYYMYSERCFILPLEESDDIKVIRVSDGQRKDTLYLDQNNLTYWILKDYEYEFNEKRFLERYFKNEEPLYTRYMRGEILENCYYYQEEDSNN